MLFLLGGLIVSVMMSSCTSGRYGCGKHGRKGYNGRYITGFKQDY